MTFSSRWAAAAAFVGALSLSANAQEFCEQMEEYNLGDFLAGNNGWEMWDNGAPTDHDITDIVANSGTKSVRTWGVADIVYGADTAKINSGVWEGSVWQYVADGTADELLPGDSSWFLYLSEYSHGGGATNIWIVQVEFNGDDTWTIDAGTAGGSTNTGAIATNQWSELKFVADLDGDSIEVFYNGASMAAPYPISGGVFGGAGGLPELDTYDMYSPTSGPASVAYYDDFLLEAQGSNGGACDTVVEIYCTAKTGLVCGVPSLSATGQSSAAATSGFEFSAAPARGNRSGILLYGNTGKAGFPFQGGTLCVNPPLKRSTPVNSGGTNGACDGVFNIDMNAFASGNLGGNPDAFLSNPGETVNVQYWGRDSVATGSFLSNGGEYTVGQ